MAAHDQRLGIWPTWRFWNDRESWRLVGLGLAAAELERASTAYEPE